MNYNEFFKEKQRLDELVKNYGELYLSLSDRTIGYYIDSSDIIYEEDYIHIKWVWHGAYQAEDSGYITMFTDLLETQDNWKSQIQNEVKEEKEKQEKLDAENKERMRQNRIAHAQAILKKEGVL